MTDGRVLYGTELSQQLLEWSRTGQARYDKVVKIKFQYLGASDAELQGFAHLHTLCTSLQELDMSQGHFAAQAFNLMCEQWQELPPGSLKLDLSSGLGG